MTLFRTPRHVLWLLLITVLPTWARAEMPVEVRSPGGDVRFELRADGGRLTYAVSRAGRSVLDASTLGLTIDGTDLARGAELGRVENYQIDERYPTRGVHSTAIDRCNGVRVTARHPASAAAFMIEVRAYDDGVAFRTVVPGGDGMRVPDEATTFRLPAASTAWYHDLRGHYEAAYQSSRAGAVKAGQWVGPPLTYKLPDGGGYASITESTLGGFAGMALQATGDAAFAARLGHAHPASYPFTLRYKQDVERLAHPAALAGTIRTPWRVIVVGADLNTLVNSDLVNNLAPPPDPMLFPQGPATPWVKPGRAVWRYLDGGQSSLEGLKEFSRLAGELGFEYQVVEGVWQRWSEAELRDLVDFSRERGVGIWLWKHSNNLRTPASRREFFGICQRAGAVGAKIDFFDHEAKEVVDLYPVLLREAAEHRLMVDFHGSNKPTGEARTWPNELGREGIYGLEHKGMKEWARHNVTLPFTRLLAGHGDYTPVHFGDRRRETSWSHQIATAAVLTSPLLVYGANPQSLLENPASAMIRSIPSVWDETIVLPGSEIGERAIMARRSGDRWFLAILNGPTAATIQVPASFLGPGEYRAMLVRDRKDEPAALTVEEATIDRDDSLPVELRPGGGFIGRFTRP